MSERRRKHYYAMFEELATRLGIPGRVIRVWVENEVDYVHFLTDDPDGWLTTPGGYVEGEALPPRVSADKRASLVEHLKEHLPEGQDHGAWDDENAEQWADEILELLS